ncbi:MAG: heme-binding protein [Proteobacteria bacterium]|nr:heme-binding protein [Pseudomonadota bacterium]
MNHPALLLAVALTVSWPLAAEEEVTFMTKNMTLKTAMRAAQAAIKSCQDGGYQVAVAVVDRGGNTQVMLRDRFAGPHTPETARRKAWTAVSFRTNTSELGEQTQAGKAQSAMRHVPGALALGGGLVIDAAGSLVGAIGVSGAPGGSLDDDCAQAGIDAIADDLAF